MKKLLLATLSLISIFVFLGCSSKATTAQKSIDEYFSKRPSKEKVNILITKEFGEEKLILAQRYENDGHQLTHMFLLNKNNEILNWSAGETPLSQCFTVNTLTYKDKRIIFGSFNDSKFVPSENKKVPVDIAKIDITLSDNKNLVENVDLDKGYLMVFDSQAEIKSANVLNKNGEVQSTLKDIEDIINKVELIKYTK